MAPLTGVGFVVLLIVSFAVLGEEPPMVADDSAQEIVDFYSDKTDAVIASAIIGTFAAAFLVMFGAVLAKALRAAGAEASAMISFAGTAIIAVGAALDGSIHFALAETADEIDPVAVQGLAALFEYDFLPFAVGLFLFLMGLGVAIVRHGVLPKWMGWVAIVASLTALTPIFFVGGIVGLLIVLASSVMLTMAQKKEAPA